MRLRALVAAAAVTAIAAAGCGDTSKTDDPTPAASAKADCPDCDPAGPSAFAQTDVGEGFYAAGDTWLVAHTYVEMADQEKHEVFIAEDEKETEAFAFAYRVLDVEKVAFDNVLRDVATVEITQADLAAVEHAELFTPQRLDTHEHKVVFELNDLLDPVSETLYSRDYPHGKRVALDAKSSLGAGATLFPRTIPRLLVNGGVDSPPPTLPVALADIVDIMDPDWSTATYLKYVFDNGDVVYWSKQRDQLWPFYVATRHGASVLVAYSGQ